MDEGNKEPQLGTEATPVTPPSQLLKTVETRLGRAQLEVFMNCYLFISYL